MFPHTITLYITERHTGPEFRDEGISNYITVLHGVFVEEKQAVATSNRGLQSSDAVSVNIPAGALALDGVTDQPKAYAAPRRWEAAGAGERSELWSLPIDGGNANRCFFVVGEVVEPDLDYAAMRKQFDGVFLISSVHDRRFGGLPHWEIGGV